MRHGLTQPCRGSSNRRLPYQQGARGEGQVEAFAAAAAAVKVALPAGSKIRLALNAVCGLSGELLAKCLAPGGTILTYGVMSREPMSVSGGQLLFKGLTYKGW